jgi:hypothetical protein
MPTENGGDFAPAPNSRMAKATQALPGWGYLSFLSSRFASAIASGSNSSAERLR